MSEGKIIEIYNKGISEVIGLIKELSNQIKEQSANIDPDLRTVIFYKFQQNYNNV